MLPVVLLAALAAGPLKLDDGDRVVLLGSTLIEREQAHGWWELALTTRYPGKRITFRNLGWSGDTVFGHAHAGYAYTRTGTATVTGGFKHLVEHTLSVKPTVLLIAYGTNESFDGPAGLDNFTKGLNTLLDALAPAKARVVLLSPLAQGTMPAPLPSPARANANLRLYADAIRGVAKKRGASFIDLFTLVGDVGKQKLSDNGIHLTEDGYRATALKLEKGLGLSETPWQLDIDAKSGTAKATGAKVERIGTEGLRFTVTDDRLPTRGRFVFATGLSGVHKLLIDGKVIDHFGLKSEDGIMVVNGPDFDQTEKLREAIVAKNELYFHRWRPQNETYLFGFRKHEQGKNGLEIPKFDPLVEAKEKEIAKLSRPTPRTYEIRPVK